MEQIAMGKNSVIFYFHGIPMCLNVCTCMIFKTLNINIYSTVYSMGFLLITMCNIDFYIVQHIQKFYKTGTKLKINVYFTKDIEGSNKSVDTLKRHSNYEIPYSSFRARKQKVFKETHNSKVTSIYTAFSNSMFCLLFLQSV